VQGKLNRVILFKHYTTVASDVCFITTAYLKSLSCV